MSSREKILAAVKANQPGLVELPVLDFFDDENGDLKEKFISVLTAIGGKVIEVNGLEEIKTHIGNNAVENNRIITTITAFEEIAELLSEYPDPLQNTYLAIIKARFGVAENGAVWVTEDIIGHRVLPFICQHLAVVLRAEDIVPNMHEAYNKTGNDKYGFATFIAGPSKTADIEQSLVLGAHGPRSMTVFLVK